MRRAAHVVVLFVIALGGCRHSPPPPIATADEPRTSPTMTREVLGGGTYTPPAASVPAPPPTSASEESLPGATKSGIAAESDDTLIITTTPTDPGFALDGMIGQVNGKAIYAHAVLEPLDAQLAALGRQLAPREFQQRAAELIGSRLQQMVTDAIIYAEAQRDLTDAENAGLNQMMQNERERLLRLYGQGSVALAEQTLREQDSSLQLKLEQFRQGVVVSKLLRDKLYPRINVTKRDIERYYDENKASYNPPATRTLRVIRVSDPDIAAQIAERLELGDPFEKLAASVVNKPNLATRGGLMASVTGDVIFREDELNQAVQQLEEGRHTPEPIPAGDEYWFIQLAKLNQPPAASLKRAQLDIERTLTDQQFRALSERYRVELFRKGSYAALDQMGRMLLQIATNRYVAGDTTAGR